MSKAVSFAIRDHDNVPSYLVSLYMVAISADSAKSRLVGDLSKLLSLWLDGDGFRDAASAA